MSCNLCVSVWRSVQVLLYDCVAVSTSDGEGVYRGLLEANLATEVGLVVLDSVGLFCIHFKDMLLFLDGDNALMRKVLDIYLSFLQIGQSESLSKHVFAALRAFINNFSVALFQGTLPTSIISFIDLIHIQTFVCNFFFSKETLGYVVVYAAKCCDVVPAS